MSTDIPTLSHIEARGYHYPAGLASDPKKPSQSGSLGFHDFENYFTDISGERTEFSKVQHCETAMMFRKDEESSLVQG